MRHATYHRAITYTEASSVYEKIADDINHHINHDINDECADGDG